MSMGMQRGYAPIHGLRMYYEIHGVANSTQPPLVLLHDGGDTIQTSFGHVLATLARDRQIIAFEQQGFGHTADITDRPFSFEQSADDTAALLEYLRIDQANLFTSPSRVLTVPILQLQDLISRPRLSRKLGLG